jgi:hypothetical protein
MRAAGYILNRIYGDAMGDDDPGLAASPQFNPESTTWYSSNLMNCIGLIAQYLLPAMRVKSCAHAPEMHIVIFPILHSTFSGFFCRGKWGGKLPAGKIVIMGSGQSPFVCVGIFLYLYVLLAQVSRDSAIFSPTSITSPTQPASAEKVSYAQIGSAFTSTITVNLPQIV